MQTNEQNVRLTNQITAITAVVLTHCGERFYINVTNTEQRAYIERYEFKNRRDFDQALSLLKLKYSSANVNGDLFDFVHRRKQNIFLNQGKNKLFRVCGYRPLDMSLQGYPVYQVQLLGQCGQSQQLTISHHQLKNLDAFVVDTHTAKRINNFLI